MSSQAVTTLSHPGVDVSDASWRSLARVGAVAAFIATALFLTDVVVLTTGGAMPASAREWLMLFQEDKVAGLLQLFFTDLFGVALMAPIVFALYGALRGVNPAYAAFATALAFVGIAVVFATNANYALIHLSDQYTAAPSPAEAAQVLAAAEATFATGISGTGPIMAGMVLELALLIFSVIMLRSAAFGKVVGYLGIAGHGLDLAHAIAFISLIPILNEDTALAIGVPLLAIGGTLQLVWYPLVAIKLLRLGRSPSRAEASAGEGGPTGAG